MTEIAVDRRYVENLEVALTTLVVMARKHGDSSELLMRAVMVAEHVLTHGYPPKIGSATPASSEALGHTRRSAAQDLPSLDQDRQPLSVEQQVFGVQSHEVVLLLSNIRASAAAGRVYGHGPTPHEPERIIARKDERFDQILAFLTKLGIEGSILRAESAPVDHAKELGPCPTGSACVYSCVDECFRERRKSESAPVDQQEKGLGQAREAMRRLFTELAGPLNIYERESVEAALDTLVRSASVQARQAAEAELASAKTGLLNAAADIQQLEAELATLRAPLEQDKQP